ncbi:MAG TPA: tyrosine-type recombinase/integrase [Phycisphaerae bacterium]|nr:tyrosine-type recombinase/integrase [Phycisphaerae bacterium]
MTLTTQAPPTPRLAELVHDFAKANALSAKPKSVRRNTRIILTFFAERGITAAEDVSPDDVQDFLVVMQERGRAPRTLHVYASALRLFFRFLHQRGIIPTNPTWDIRLARPEQSLPIYLTPAEAERTLEQARRSGVFVEVAVALFTGLRMSELRFLRWEDVDLTARRLTVRRSKSGRVRTVWLCGMALAALREQKAQYGRKQWVFPGGRGGHHNGKVWDHDHPRSLTWWDRIALRPLQVAIPKFQARGKGKVGSGWHLFRHSFASRLIQAGVSIYKVSKWLGHASVGTTHLYAHLSPTFDADIERAE